MHLVVISHLIQFGVVWFGFKLVSVLGLLINLCLSSDISLRDMHWISFKKVVIDTDLDKLQGF